MLFRCFVAHFIIFALMLGFFWLVTFFKIIFVSIHSILGRNWATTIVTSNQKRKSKSLSFHQNWNHYDRFWNGPIPIDSNAVRNITVWIHCENQMSQTNYTVVVVFCCFIEISSPIQCSNSEIHLPKNLVSKINRVCEQCEFNKVKRWKRRIRPREREWEIEWKKKCR